jgi:hypothetical protein
MLDWFSTATFTAYGSLEKENIPYDDGGSFLRVKSSFYLSLGFYDEHHLKKFLESHKILCGHSSPNLRITGTLDLTKEVFYPHTIRRSDTGISAAIFRMKLEPLDYSSDEPGCGHVYAGISKSIDEDCWTPIHKKITSNLLHATLKVASRSVECSGIIYPDGYLCRHVRAAQAFNVLKQPSDPAPKPKPKPVKQKRAVSLRKRIIVLARDNYKCVKCGASPGKDKNVLLHVDHIIPFSRGGSCNVQNLQTLCESCNLGKGNRLEIDLIDLGSDSIFGSSVPYNAPNCARDDASSNH